MADEPVEQVRLGRDDPDPTLATLAAMEKDIANLKESIVSGDMTQGVIAAGRVEVLAERVAGLDRLVAERYRLKEEHRTELREANAKALDAAFASQQTLTSALFDGFREALGTITVTITESGKATNTAINDLKVQQSAAASEKVGGASVVRAIYAFAAFIGVAITVALAIIATQVGP